MGTKHQRQRWEPSTRESGGNLGPNTAAGTKQCLTVKWWFLDLVFISPFGCVFQRSWHVICLSCADAVFNARFSPLPALQVWRGPPVLEYGPPLGRHAARLRPPHVLWSAREVLTYSARYLFVVETVSNATQFRRSTNMRVKSCSNGVECYTVSPVYEYACEVVLERCRIPQLRQSTNVRVMSWSKRCRMPHSFAGPRTCV